MHGKLLHMLVCRQSGSRKGSGAAAGWHLSGFESSHAEIDAEPRQRVRKSRLCASAAAYRCIVRPQRDPFPSFFPTTLTSPPLQPGRARRRLESSQVTLLNPQWTRSDWGPQVPRARMLLSDQPPIVFDAAIFSDLLGI
jgi:hypothetical protein